LDQAKESLRKKILTLLRQQEEEKRQAKSLAICSKLLKDESFCAANIILFYASFDGEVETLDIMKKAQTIGKKIALPKVEKETRQIIPIMVNNLNSDLEKGDYGIDQPIDNKDNYVDINELDLVIVPGVAFDRHNYRLGRGLGYYDRFLSKLSSNIPMFGLAFDFQILEELHFKEPHDIAVTKVVTN